MNVIKKVGANFVSRIGYFILLVGIKSTISVIHSLVLEGKVLGSLTSHATVISLLRCQEL